MKIGGLEVRKGEKRNVYLEVEGCEYQLPMTVIRGSEGSTVLVTAGMHNAEYVGIQAAIELGRELEPDNIEGTLIIIPVVNTSGFCHRTMSLVYEDNKNLYREFPGCPDGTVADKICQTIVTEVFPHVDYYIDLHSGDGFEQLIPYCYYIGPVDDRVKEKSLGMARCMDVKYLVESRITAGGAYNYAASLGIPSILLERGGMGSWSREEVEKDKQDILRVLDYLYGRDSKTTYPEEKIIFQEAAYELAPYTGCWYPSFPVGSFFKKGDILGEIRNYFGEPLYTCEAPSDGFVLYQTGSLNVLEDGPMIAYGICKDQG